MELKQFEAYNQELGRNVTHLIYPREEVYSGEYYKLKGFAYRCKFEHVKYFKGSVDQSYVNRRYFCDPTYVIVRDGEFVLPFNSGTEHTLSTSYTATSSINDILECQQKTPFLNDLSSLPRAKYHELLNIEQECVDDADEERLLNLYATYPFLSTASFDSPKAKQDLLSRFVHSDFSQETFLSILDYYAFKSEEIFAADNIYMLVRSYELVVLIEKYNPSADIRKTIVENIIRSSDTMAIEWVLNFKNDILEGVNTVSFLGAAVTTRKLDIVKMVHSSLSRFHSDNDEWATRAYLQCVEHDTICTILLWLYETFLITQKTALKVAKLAAEKGRIIIFERFRIWFDFDNPDLEMKCLLNMTREKSPYILVHYQKKNPERFKDFCKRDPSFPVTIASHLKDSKKLQDSHSIFAILKKLSK